MQFYELQFLKKDLIENKLENSTDLVDMLYTFNIITVYMRIVNVLFFLTD